MPPEDDFTRTSDPAKRRNATFAGLVVATAVAVLAAAVLLTRSPSPTAGPNTASSTPAPAAPLTAPPSPVPAEPVVGSGFSAVDDPTTHQLVLVGGIDSYDTTWLWNGHRWALAHPPVSPPGRFGAAAAYDPRTGVVLLYGGRLGPGEVVDDTWAWDGTTWRELDSGSGSPPSGEGSVMAWDNVLDEMVLVNSNGGFGGQTWTWTGARWVRQLSGDLPAGTFFVGLAVDPVTQALLAASCCSVGQGTTSTWTWNGTVWRRLSTRAQPAFTAGLALDPASDRVVMCGDPAFVAGREMWSWTGHDWSLLTGARLPVFPEAEVTGVEDGHLVILGSFIEPVQGAPQPIHLWSWTGTRWDQLE
jgi:hypothetical protein